MSVRQQMAGALEKEAGKRYMEKTGRGEREKMRSIIKRKKQI